MLKYCPGDQKLHLSHTLWVDFISFNLFTFEVVVQGAVSCLDGGCHCCGRSMMSRHLLVPIGQHLSAKAQGWQDNMASTLFLRSKGAGDLFFHFLHARAGTKMGPLRGRRPDRLGLVPFDHAQ